MGKNKKVEESLKRLEKGIERIAEVFDQYTETVRQEIAFINQKIIDLESRIDSIENWSSFTVEGGETREAPAGTGLSAELASRAGEKSAHFESAPPAEDYRTRVEASTTLQREARGVESRPASTTRTPAGRRLEPASFITREHRAETGEEGFGGYRPVRGGIVEEKFVRPSVFSKEMNRLHEAASTPQTPYGPGGYTPPPSMQLRSEISRVLGKIRPEAQVRVPRPPAVQEPGPAPGYQGPGGPEDVYSTPQPVQRAYASETPGSAGETRTIRLPDNWLPESSRAKYFNPKKLKKGTLKDMEKKTKDIFK